MHRHPLDLIQLFFSLFRELPRLTSALVLPGAAALVAYPALSVLLGPGNGGQAFATAFLIGFAAQCVFGFEGVLRRVRTVSAPVGSTLVALAVVCLPLLVLTAVDDPLWCQRVQSAVYLGLGALFAVDLLSGRLGIAARFWPDAEMRAHLPNLTRGMVVYAATLLVLNETMIQITDPSQWLLFWAVLPLLSQVLLRAMVLTAINLDNTGQPV